MTEVHWLDWAQRLAAIAQSGLAYCQNPFDIERYEQIRVLAAEMVAHNSDADLSRVQGLLDEQVGYATPKVDVRGAVFRGDEILLVKELSDGGWTLPGGWADVNEPPSQAAEREVREESGYEVRAVRLMGVYDRNQHGFPRYFFHIYKLVIECELIGGEAKTSIETGGAAFFAENALPTLSVQRTTPELLARLFDQHRRGAREAEFD